MFMKKNITFWISLSPRLIFGLFLLCMTTGCVENLYNGDDPEIDPIEKPGNGDFTFSTTKESKLNINYDSREIIPFQIYLTNPVSIVNDSEVWDENLEPYFADYTDEDGIYSEEYVFPAHIKEIYLCTKKMGYPSCVKLELTDTGVEFDMSAPVTKARAIQTKAVNGPLDLNILGGWDAMGVPDYLLERASVPADVLNRISAYLPERYNKNLKDIYPELFDGATTCIHLKERAKLNLIFLHEGATIKNLLGYYHYPTGKKTAKEHIQATIAFPNCSFKYDASGKLGGGGLSNGDQIQLKYWNGSSFEEEFPENTTIEFVLLVNAFDTDKGDIKKDATRIFYTTPEYNDQEQIKDQPQRSVALYDKQNKLVAIGFEDTYNPDDYNDVVFSVRSFPEDAIDNNGIVPLPPIEDNEEDNSQSYTHTGVLAFEDLWPNQGDYDMNDVITQYTSHIYTTPQGVTKLEDHITVKWCGGDIPSGFGYQLDVKSGQIKSCTVSPQQSSVAVNDYGVEAGQDKATIIVFDDIRKVVGTTFTITTEFTKPISASLLNPPYNPFIIPGLGNGDRGKEVHLTDNAPTDLADPTLLGTGNDLSNPENNKYYFSKDNFPFAIHIPETTFLTPKENVRIDESYPLFSKWVISLGNEYKDWYLHPDEENIEETSPEE